MEKGQGRIFEEMDKADKRGTLTINKEATTLYEMFGYSDPMKMFKDALTNKKLGSLVAFEKVLEDMGAENVIPFVLLIDGITGKESENGLSEIMCYLNDNFTEEQLVEFVAKVVQARRILKGRQ